MIAAINHLTGRHPASYQVISVVLYTLATVNFLSIQKNIWLHLIDIALICFIPGV